MATKYLITDTELTDIADAIRAKNGSNDKYKPSEMATAILALRTISDTADLVEYLQWNQAVQSFIENVVYDSSDYTVSHVNVYTNFSDLEASTYPLGYTIGGTENGQVIEVTENGNGVLSGSISDVSYVIYNLIPNKEYLYSVHSGNSIVKSGYIKPIGRVRQIRTFSVWNMRDLGGWCGSTGTIKYGLIYRSGHFDSISDDDKALLRDVLKIKEDIDLRSVADAGSASKLGTDIAFLDAPLVGYTDDFTSRIEQLKMIFTDIFSRVSAGEALDFHCSAGCDRTGTVAYIILALLGVSQSDIDKEYELTTMTLSNTQAHRTTEAYASMVTNYIAGLTGNTLEEKIIRYFINTLEFSTSDINDFRNTMLTVKPTQYYKVTLNLNDVTIDNSADLIIGESYIATLTYNNSAMLSVIVMMGNENITNASYSNGKISIQSVTGDITIVATATTASYTNLVRTSIDSDGSVYNNGIGYLDGKYMSAGVPSLSADSNATVTGYIPINSADTTGDVYRIKGVGEPSSSHTRMCIANNSFSKISEYNSFLSGSTTVSGFELSTETASDGSTIYVLTVSNKLSATYSNCAYLRFSFDGTNGKDLVITVNEEIV